MQINTLMEQTNKTQMSIIRNVPEKNKLDFEKNFFYK